jgi:hypothetical protein
MIKSKPFPKYQINLNGDPKYYRSIRHPAWVCFFRSISNVEIVYKSASPSSQSEPRVQNMKYPAVIVYLASLFAVGEPHGYMFEPLQRSSMWRRYTDSPKNYDDNELFCGGREVGLFAFVLFLFALTRRKLCTQRQNKFSNIYISYWGNKKILFSDIIPCAKWYTVKLL